MDEALIKRVVDLAVQIQQIPAPTFAETRRSTFIHSLFEQEGLSDIATDSLGNVYARLPGNGSSLPMVVTAHTDTVFPASTDLRVLRDQEWVAGPGIGDNSLGVAGLFGLLWALPRSDSGQGSNLPGDLWLVANVGEEGLGNLRGMRAVVDRFQDQVRAYLILEGMAFGQIYHRGLGVQRYRIHVTTPGGHSWVDYGRPSAVHVLAEIITNLTGLPLPRNPRTSLNVGVISGGTSVNTIAAKASLELDLRSEGVDTLAELSGRVEKIVQEANHGKVQVKAELIGQRPAGEIPRRHPLVRLAALAWQIQGIAPRYNIGSTDAHIPLSQGLPAICLGLTSGSGAHTIEEQIHIPPLSQGLASVITLVKSAYERL